MLLTLTCVVFDKIVCEDEHYTSVIFSIVLWEGEDDDGDNEVSTNYSSLVEPPKAVGSAMLYNVVGDTSNFAGNKVWK